MTKHALNSSSVKRRIHVELAMDCEDDSQQPEKNFGLNPLLRRE